MGNHRSNPCGEESNFMEKLLQHRISRGILPNFWSYFDIYFDVCIHSFNPFDIQLSSEVGRWNKSRLVHMIFIVRIGNITLEKKTVSTTMTESTESLYTNKNRLSFRHSEKI